MKKRSVSYENSLSTINELINIFSNNDFLKTIQYPSENIKRQLFEIRENLHKINPYDDQILSIFYENSFIQLFIHIKDAFKAFQSHTPPHIELNKKFLEKTISELFGKIANLNAQLISYLYSSQQIYNSEEYYFEQIKEIEKEKQELQNYLQQQQNTEKRNKKEFKEKEIALSQANERIKEYQTELEEKRKKENAVIEWDSKIKSTFEELGEHLKPISKEHRRLHILFFTYASLTALLITAIISFEMYIFLRLKSSNIPFQWENHLITIIPTPILAGLLWTFIAQLNRTQRQLVVLAKHIHEIKYTEGLLLSTNSLSININDSIKRINRAIEQLLENHLENSKRTDLITEKSILREEQKDSLPIDLVIKVLKEAKDIIKK